MKSGAVWESRGLFMERGKVMRETVGRKESGRGSGGGDLTGGV